MSTIGENGKPCAAVPPEEEAEVLSGLESAMADFAWGPAPPVVTQPKVKMPAPARAKKSEPPPMPGGIALTIRVRRPLFRWQWRFWRHESISFVR